MKEGSAWDEGQRRPGMRSAPLTLCTCRLQLAKRWDFGVIAHPPALEIKVTCRVVGLLISAGWVA